MLESPFFEISVFIIIILAAGTVVWYYMRERYRQTEKDAYVDALECLVEGNERLAIQRLKEAIREDSENISAYLYLGDILRKRGLVNNAIRIHRDLTLRANLTSQQQSRILRSLFLNYEVSGNIKEGIAIADRILKLESKLEGSLVRKFITILEKNGDWQAAEKIVDRFSDVLPEEYQKRSARYSVMEGLRLLEMGEENGKEARLKFKQAYKKDPECAAAYYYLGKSYQQEDRPEEAVQAWKELCQKVPEKAHWVFPVLEKTWFEIGRFADAESLYQELLRTNKNGLEAGLALVEFYNKKGEYDSAIELLKQMEGEFHNAPSLMSKKVDIYYNKGLYKDAAAFSLALFKAMSSEHGSLKAEDEIRRDILNLS